MKRLLARTHARLHGHEVVFRARLQPDHMLGKGIAVFNQDTFQIPHAHYDCCDCGKTWILHSRGGG